MPYPVNTIYPCVQGEGVMTGTPMILVRLQGCSVRCDFCDTKETWSLQNSETAASIESVVVDPTKYCWVSAEDIRSYIERQWGESNFRWILLTGGEPAMYNLSHLTFELHRAQFRTALETSGVADGLLGAYLDWICVSPKIGVPGGEPVLELVVMHAHELKFVVGKQGDVQAVVKFLDEFRVPRNCSKPVVSVQPMSLSEKATQICVKAVMEYGWRLSLQTHKFIGIP